ncbi:uncharacterized protein [Pempheris klunzingeri]|uniref:uncharacterized protein n=1 Tax=Pempheris klunzingeri TaxID=3127111 RepID=UPI00398193EA
MDQLLDMYINAEGPSGDRSKWTREIKSSENIYANEDEIHTLEHSRTGPARSGAGEVKKSSCRAAAVFLALLCLLLLTGLITLVFLHTKGNSDWKTEMVQLHTSYNNLTKDRDQLQISYNNLTKDRDQLQISYNNLTKDRDQLQTSYNNLTKDRDQLQTSYNYLSRERDQLQKTRDDLQRELQVLNNRQGWMYFRGSLYYISHLEKSWQESRADCLQRGTDLVIINSKEEQVCVEVCVCVCEFTRSFQKLLWIGLTDRQREGTWKWVDGTPLTTSYWAPHEPNGIQYRDEDCAEIKLFHQENNWNDESCDRRRSWICEKTLREFCPQRSTFSQSIIMENHYEDLADVSARSVAIKSSSEMTAAVPGRKLYRLVVVSFGLLCILQAALNISLRLALYNSDSMTRHNETIWKELTEERDGLMTKLTEIDQYSRKGWVYFSGSVYYISSIMETWQNSRDDCLKRSADLMIINSKEEQTFTGRFQKLLWIGLTDREKEGTWKWVDGTPLTTSYWTYNEPNGASDRDEDCAEIKDHNLRNSWNDESCDLQKFWICEKTMT